MKKVLLTGATGLIGRQAIPMLLRRNYEVHAVYYQARDLPDVNQDGVYWHQCNLLDNELLIKLLIAIAPSHLLHLAWCTEHGKYWSSWDNVRWVQASLTLLLNFVEKDGRRAVFCGSCAEYDWSYGFCSEQVTPTKPSTLYGCCKNSLQEMLTRLSTDSALSSAWGRVFFFYGPHEHAHRLVSSVIASLLQGRHANCTHGNQIRDYLFVKDVADALVALLDSDVEGPVNIASGQPICLRQIICRIAEKLGCQDMISLGALPADSSDSPLVVADVQRLTKEVRWYPSYNLDSGLDETIGWWKQYLLNG
jgi:nucleoside-diphosphate-sugar epimerase